MSDTENIKSLLEKEIEQLYIDLGRQILSSDYHAFPFPKQRYITKAKNWLAENKVHLKQKICKNEYVKLHMNSNKIEDRVILISAIIDLISSMCIGISPVTVAVLLVKEGINSLCSKDAIV